MMATQPILSFASVEANPIPLEEQKMDHMTAIRYAAHSEGVLFLGAGFSMDVTNVVGLPLPSSGELATLLAQLVDLPPDTPLTLAAETFLDECGPDELIEAVKPRFTAAPPIAEPYATIAGLPWRRVYTTNYDDLFEKAAESAGKAVFAVTLADRVRDIPKHKLCCVHLNGFVARLDRHSVDTELKLTDSSYLSRAIFDTEWAVLLRQDLRLAKSIVFVGYSLYDYEIRKLLTDIPGLSDKTVFIIGPSPNAALVKRIEHYGKPVAISTVDFGGSIDTAIKELDDGSAPELADVYVAVREFKPPTATNKPTDGDVWKMLLQGAVDLQHVHYSLTSNEDFILQRSRTKKVRELIEKGHRVFAVLSELGNGKTMFLTTLQFDLAASGYRVFWIEEAGDLAEQELIALSTASGKKAFILENYPDRRSLVQAFALNANRESLLLLTSRTSVHDLFVDGLADMFGGSPPVELRLDVLDDDEIAWFTRLLNVYGMWAHRAGSTDRKKNAILRKECHGQIHGILLRMLDSPQMQQRVKALFSPLEGYQDVLICLMVMTVMGHAIDVDLLGDIVGVETISSRAFRSDPRIRQLVGFDSHSVNVRSPTIGEFYLTRLADRSAILSVIIRLAHRTANARFVGYKFKTMFEALQRFSIVQRLFPKEGKLPAILSYYENIKSLDGCVKNYHFWLQYAIACLTLGERERSQRYFDQAFAIAREARCDTYMVDNHYSRYLLETAVEYPDPAEAMLCFRQGRDIINRQMRDDRLHYPYRVALQYVGFVNRFGTRLTRAWIDEIEQAAQSVSDRIPELPEERRANRYVRQCEKDMDYVLYKCAEMRRRRSV